MSLLHLLLAAPLLLLNAASIVEHVQGRLDERLEGLRAAEPIATTAP